MVVAQHGAGVGVFGHALIEPVGDLVEVRLDEWPGALKPSLIVVSEPDPPLHLNEDVFGVGMTVGGCH
jgi:hypothetical protein